MRELNVNELQEVNGGNPLVAIVVVTVAKKVAQAAAPHVKSAVLTVIATIAGNAGVEAGKK